MSLTEKLSADARRMRFARIAREAVLVKRENGADGFGTLREKRMHATVKRYLCEDGACQEVGVPGTRYIADVCVGEHLYEVQTGSLFPLREKLAAYLDQTGYIVTVVRPLAVNRTMCWIDPENGAVSPPRKIHYHSRPEELLADLYPIRRFLPNPRMRVRLLLLEVVDYRLLNGWSPDRKKGSERYERVPAGLLEDWTFEKPEDYLRLFPEDLPDPFTVREFSEKTHLRGRDIHNAVRFLEAMGLLFPTGKRGRAMLWSRNGQNPEHNDKIL